MKTVRILDAAFATALAAVPLAVVSVVAAAVFETVVPGGDGERINRAMILAYAALICASATAWALHPLTVSAARRRLGDIRHAVTSRATPRG